MKLLITGASGTLGSELAAIAAGRSGIELLTPSRAELDITDSQHVYHWMEVNTPEVVIHCAAYTDVAGAETRDGYREALDTNVEGTRNLVHALIGTRQGQRFIHISTDYVYEGMFGNHDEADRLLPFCRYGTTKMLAEDVIERSHLHGHVPTLVVRTSFKPKGPWPHPAAFEDVYTSADYVDVIAPMVWRAAMEKVEGVLNIGTARKSVLDLARRRTPSVNAMQRSQIVNVSLPHDVSMSLAHWQLRFGEQ